MPPATTAAYYRELVGSIVAGRPWIVATDVQVGAAARGAQLMELGASKVLSIATTRGTGDLPEPGLVQQLTLDVRAGSLMAGIHAAERLLEDLPADVCRQVDEFDPAREARVLRAIFSTNRPVAGRSVYAGREDAWVALEDKTVCDALWDRAGIPSAPSRNVPVEAAAVRRAAAELGFGAEYVVAGDSHSGFNGGAEFVRWIRTAANLEAALEFFRGRCLELRVMPLLEGVPCSIHGFVLPDTVVTLRPCEMVSLRDLSVPAFVYAGSASFWDPPGPVRRELRECARLVGAELARSVGYRGAYTIDGVWTSEGFRPTELNPRFGAALATMTRGLEELPLSLLNAAITEGEPFDWRAEELERLLLEHIEAHPCARAVRTITNARIDETRRGELVLEGGGWRPARAGEPPSASWMLGPSLVGGICFITLAPERTPQGPPSASLLAGALCCLDRAHGLGLGALEAAPGC